MSVKKIVTPPHQALLAMCDAISLTDVRSLRELLLDLVDTLEVAHDPPGVGLSAPQIDCVKRVFLARVADDEKSKPVIFINPEYVAVSKQMSTKKESYQRLEGCLSIPNMYGVVRRHVWVELKYFTLEFDLLKSKDVRLFSEGIVQKVDRFEGFLSRVIQHEFDHLNGILFTQRVLEQKGQLYEVGVDAKGKEVLYEVNL